MLSTILIVPSLRSVAAIAFKLSKSGIFKKSVKALSPNFLTSEQAALIVLYFLARSASLACTRSLNSQQNSFDKCIALILKALYNRESYTKGGDKNERTKQKRQRK